MFRCDEQSRKEQERSFPPWISVISGVSGSFGVPEFGSSVISGFLCISDDSRPAFLHEAQSFLHTEVLKAPRLNQVPGTEKTYPRGMPHHARGQRTIIRKLHQASASLMSIPLMAEVMTTQNADRRLHVYLDGVHPDMEADPGHFFCIFSLNPSNVGCGKA